MYIDIPGTYTFYIHICICTLQGIWDTCGISAVDQAFWYPFTLIINVLDLKQLYSEGWRVFQVYLYKIRYLAADCWKTERLQSISVLKSSQHCSVPVRIVEGLKVSELYKYLKE